MSQREKCAKLLESVPDYKIGIVLAYLEGLMADEEEDERFCLQMWERYENDPEKDVSYPLEECKREWGIG